MLNLRKDVWAQHNGCYTGSWGMGISENTFISPHPRVTPLQHPPHVVLSIVSFHLPSKDPGTFKYTVLLPVIFETLPKLACLRQTCVSVAPHEGGWTTSWNIWLLVPPPRIVLGTWAKPLSVPCCFIWQWIGKAISVPSVRGCARQEVKWRVCVCACVQCALWVWGGVFK